MSSPRERIESVGARFATYLREMEIPYDNLVYQQSRGIEHLTYCLKTYFMFLSFIVDHGILNGQRRGVLSLAAFAESSVSAIRACLLQGNPIQARVLLRSLWETAVYTKFIFDDFELRISRYEGYKDFCKYHEMVSGNPAVPPSEHQYLNARFQQIGHLYEENRDWYYKLVDDIMRSNPTKYGKRRPTFRVVAELAGLEQDYNTMYHLMSFAVHGDSVIDHLFMNKQQRFQLGPNHSRGLAKPTIGMSIHYAHMVYDTILARIDSKESLSVRDYSLWLVEQTLKACK